MVTRAAAPSLSCVLAVLLALSIAVAPSLAQAGMDQELVDCVGMSRLTATYDQLKHTATRYASQGNDLAALECFEAAAAASAKFGGAWADLAQHQSKLGLAEKAIQSWTKCTRWSPKYYGCHVNLANLLREQRRFGESEEHFQKAMQLEPANPAVLNNLAILQYETNRLEEAYRTFSKSLELDPTQSEAHYNLGNILRDHGSLDDAVKKYKTALQLHPHDIRSKVNLAICLNDLGRYQSAVDVYAELVSMLRKADVVDSSSGAVSLADAYYNLGVSQWRLGRLEAARKSFLQCLQQQNQKPKQKEASSGLQAAQKKTADAMANIARIDRLLHKPEHALAGFDRALKTHANYTALYGEMAVALLTAQRHRLATGADADRVLQKYSHAVLSSVRDEVTPRYNKSKKEWVVTATVSTRPVDLLFLSDDPVLLKNLSVRYEGGIVGTRQRRVSLAPFEFVFPSFEDEEGETGAATGGSSSRAERRPLKIALLVNRLESLLELLQQQSFWFPALEFLRAAIQRHRAQIVCYHRSERMSLLPPLPPPAGEGEDAGDNFLQSICPSPSQTIGLGSLSTEEAAERMHADGLDVLLFLSHPSEDDVVGELGYYHPAAVQVALPLVAPFAFGAANIADYVVLYSGSLVNVSRDLFVEKDRRERAIFVAPPEIRAADADTVVPPTRTTAREAMTLGWMNPDWRFLSQELLDHVILPVARAAPNLTLLVAAGGQQRQQQWNGLQVVFVSTSEEIARRATVCLDSFPVHSPHYVKMALETADGCPVVSVMGQSPASRVSGVLLNDSRHGGGFVVDGFAAAVEKIVAALGLTSSAEQEIVDVALRRPWRLVVDETPTVESLMAGLQVAVERVRRHGSAGGDRLRRRLRHGRNGDSGDRGVDGESRSWMEQEELDGHLHGTLHMAVGRQ